MNFEPSDEDTMIADSVDRFGERHYPPASRLAILADVQASRARWADMAALGWLGLGLSRGAPRTAADDTFVMALMERFGRHLMLEPLVTRCVLAPALLEGGTSDALLAGIEEGRTAVSLALGEPGAGFALDHVATVATVYAGGFRLTGTKDHAVDGADADWFVVPARTAGAIDDRAGISLFLIARDAPGLTVERFRSIDGHRHARLRLADVDATHDALLGARDCGYPVLAAAVDRAIVAHLAEALGSMDAAAAAALDYLKTRHQFGRAIGTFQVLQHRIVDMNIACEEARSMVYHATGALSGDPAARPAAIAAAKARVGQCGLFVTRQAVQLHGGLGVSAELIVSHHLKRQMMLDLAYGNAAYQVRRFADATRLAA